MKVAIATTSINIPIFLESYIRNFKEHSINYGEITFIIIDDLKSPNQDIKDYIGRLSPSFTVEHWNANSQKKWEQFGYVVAESITCGTPVLAF